MAVQSPTTIYAIPPVQAGDLIVAAYFNKLVAALVDLDARVRALETRPIPVPSSPPAPAGLAITSAVLTSIGETTAINVVGSGLEPSGLNSYKINNIPFTPLGSVLGDDGEIVIAVPPNANAQILAAIANAGRVAFTLTLGSTKNQTASASVGGMRLVFDPGDFTRGEFVIPPDVLAGIIGTGTGTPVPGNVGTAAGANVGNVGTVAGFNPGSLAGMDVGNVGSFAGTTAAGRFAGINPSAMTVGPNFANIAGRMFAAPPGPDEPQ